MERAPVRLSLLRKISWLGGDRRLVGMAGLLLFLIGYTMFVAYGLFYGIPFVVPALFFFAILWAAREFNKSDPWHMDIFIRQTKYKKYYGPSSDLGVEHPQVRDF